MAFSRPAGVVVAQRSALIFEIVYLMVFANLQPNEKDAFFSLLDEYFSSRPDIFASANSASASAEATPASAVHKALASNPEVTSRLISAGLKHGVPKSSPYAAAASDPEVNNAVGRVAAASLAFSGSRSSDGVNAPPPPRRTPSSSTPPTKAAVPLPATKKFGDVDTSSAKNMFASLRNSTANKSAVSPPPAAPSAFVPKANTFGPPPVRRVPPTTSESSAHRRQSEPAKEEEVEGEWAEALYDYSSEDPGDLEIQENQRVLVTERTSAEWWTGEVDGRKGLFPASYVKVL